MKISGSLDDNDSWTSSGIIVAKTIRGAIDLLPRIPLGYIREMISCHRIKQDVFSWKVRDKKSDSGVR